jgi:hypothetical protein
VIGFGKAAAEARHTLRTRLYQLDARALLGRHRARLRSPLAGLAPPSRSTEVWDAISGLPVLIHSCFVKCLTVGSGNTAYTHHMLPPSSNVIVHELQQDVSKCASA